MNKSPWRDGSGRLCDGAEGRDQGVRRLSRHLTNLTHCQSRPRLMICNDIVLMCYLVLRSVLSCRSWAGVCRNHFYSRPRVCNAAFPHTIAHHIVVFKTLCCSECQSDLGWQHQDTGTRLVTLYNYSEIYKNV